jgi:hypothetical protein
MGSSSTQQEISESLENVTPYYKILRKENSICGMWIYVTKINSIDFSTLLSEMKYGSRSRPHVKSSQNVIFKGFISYRYIVIFSCSYSEHILLIL